MRSIGQIRLFFLFAAAVAIGAGAGRFIVSEWVMPRPPQFADWKAAHGGKGGVVRGGGERAKLRGEGRGMAIAREAVGQELPRVHRLISEHKVGPYRPGAVKVARDANGSLVVRRMGLAEARRGFGIALRNARKRVKAPVEERYARRVSHESGSANYESPKAPGVYPGDVYLSGIPMIDQGGKAYCAVASAARVLQNYGIEITMDDMAQLAGSSETCGTSIRRWERALKNVANAHGMELRTVCAVTESEIPLSRLLYDYNQTARDMGEPELYTWDYSNAFIDNYRAFDRDYDYPIQREAVLSDIHKGEAFAKNVTERIDDSDPLFWSVLLGDVPEQTPYGDKMILSDGRSGHMRLIIGYNTEREEILYSDSWGEGHELKRMDSADALSITKGLYYLTD